MCMMGYCRVSPLTSLFFFLVKRKIREDLLRLQYTLYSGGGTKLELKTHFLSYQPTVTFSVVEAAAEMILCLGDQRK